MVIIEMLQKLYRVMISSSNISVVKDETPTRCVAVFCVELQAHLLDFRYIEKTGTLSSV